MPFINGFEEKETFYSENGRQLPDEFVSFLVSFLKLEKVKLWLSSIMQQFDVL